MLGVSGGSEPGQSEKENWGPTVSRPTALTVYLKEANFVYLRVRRGSATSLCYFTAPLVCTLLRGADGFFALPEGNPERPAVLAVVERDCSSESIRLL